MGLKREERAVCTHVDLMQQNQSNPEDEYEVVCKLLSIYVRVVRERTHRHDSHVDGQACIMSNKTHCYG